MANKWIKKLQATGDAVVEHYNPFNNVIQTPSPSVNFSFGKGFGLPRGYSASFYGPPGGGKSLLLNATIGQLHRDDPEAIAVKFDTEFREAGQLTLEDYATWGIDPDRLITFQTNSPMGVFDKIATEINAMCQEGAPIALIGIDSINAIMGRRAMNADTIETQQIGDEALTIQTGLKMVLPVQRKHKIGLIMTSHVRAEMDMLEQKRGNKVRMAASFGMQHHTEYFLYIERNRNAEAKKDLSGKDFITDGGSKKIEVGNADLTAHKIRTIMKKSSMGVAGRVGEFTLDYKKGIINLHEEVFLLGMNRGIIERPNLQTYRFAGKDYRGKEAMVNFLKEHPEASQQVLKDLRQADIEGRLVEPTEHLEEEEESAE